MADEQQPITEGTAKKLVNLLSKSPLDEAAVKSFDFAKKPVLHLRNHQIIAGIAGTTGLIIFALGIENLMTNVLNVSSPFIEIILGLILLSVSGLLLKKLI